MVHPINQRFIGDPARAEHGISGTLHLLGVKIDKKVWQLLVRLIRGIYSNSYGASAKKSKLTKPQMEFYLQQPKQHNPTTLPLANNTASGEGITRVGLTLSVYFHYVNEHFAAKPLLIYTQKQMPRQKATTTRDIFCLMDYL